MGGFFSAASWEMFLILEIVNELCFSTELETNFLVLRTLIYYESFASLRLAKHQKVKFLLFNLALISFQGLPPQFE
jgi:hypothetical protein